MVYPCGPGCCDFLLSHLLWLSLGQVAPLQCLLLFNQKITYPSPSFLLPAWHPYKTRACVAKALQSRRSFQFRLHRWAGPFPIDPEYLVDPALLRVWQARLAHRHDPSVLQRQPGAH